MNGMRTAIRDFAEFLSGVLTECMGFTRIKLEQCLFVYDSNETRVVPSAKPATLEKFWLHITKLVVIKRSEALNPRLSVVYTWSVHTVVFKNPHAEDLL